ncbi:MAG: subclass B1 metallo-beta-lactamase [bacterium]|nr:subclass B1 metallo-beta-lactamase [bacterium]
MFKLFLCTLAICLTFCPLSADSQNKTFKQGETLTIHKDVRVKQLTENIWLHTTYKKTKKYGNVPGNGLIVISGKKAALIDLPWTNEQTARLCDWIKKELHADIQCVIPTHSHPDCIGGLAEAHRRGALSYTFAKTAEFAKEKGEPIPKITFDRKLEIKCGTIPLVLEYLGGGHTLDNSIVYLPQQNILFAGCMIKSANAKTMGYTKEADMENWPTTLKALKKKYGTARLVIPGHGRPGSIELVDHTLELLKQQ